MTHSTFGNYARLALLALSSALAYSNREKRLQLAVNLPQRGRRQRWWKRRNRGSNVSVQAKLTRRDPGHRYSCR
jgi:hypothetical protein